MVSLAVPGFLLISQAVTLHHFVKRSARYLEQARSTRFIAAAVIENAAEMGTQDLIQSHGIIAAVGSTAVSLQRHITRTDKAARRKDHSTLNDIFQLPNIAWPVVLLQEFHGTWREIMHLLALAMASLRQEVFDQKGDVIPAFAQGRQMKHNATETVIEICTKDAGFHTGFQVGVGRGDDTDINGSGHSAADPADFPLL